jgi:AhpD family alkylhydroperoxidase
MDPELRTDNWNYFKEKYPEAHKAFNAFGKAIQEQGPLSERECHLIKIAVAAASQYDYALGNHIERALEGGCTREEIEHAILLTATTAGFPRMMTALLAFRTQR